MPSRATPVAVPKSTPTPSLRPSVKLNDGHIIAGHMPLANAHLAMPAGQGRLSVGYVRGWGAFQIWDPHPALLGHPGSESMIGP